jgi:pimeloyl-ACP methyl ester carboxylesterase
VTTDLLWILLRLRFAPRRVRRKAFLELVLPPGQKYSEEIAQRLAAVFGHDIADMPPITKQQINAMRRHDVTSRLHELSGLPALVISGDKDMIARPSSGRAIAAGIAGSRYLEIPGASHAFPILEAERCAALLLDHLLGVP